MAKKPQKHGFSVRGFDVNHYKQTEGYVQAIDKLYSTAIHSFSRLAGSVKVDPDKPFDFASSPTFQKRAQEIVNTLAEGMTAVIQHGTEEQWLYACKKNDAFIAHIMDTSKIGKRQLNRMQDRNLDALSAFQARKVDGMDLSQRVWHFAGQTKGLMEMGIDIAVGDGRSAEQLSRDLREYLLEPNKLFRRVRDKHGNLVLSKRAAAYHPGQGVYRSSYKNAIRLARTEINMAYRDSDRYRWNNMDFIVGYRVHLSNNHTLNGEPFHDICDELAGDYPKDFVFKGWHPNCRCFVTPILQDPDEFDTDELNEMKAAFYGTEYKKYQSRNVVTDVPKGFQKWVKKHKDASLNWRKQPYWIRDNFKGGTLAGPLMLRKPVIPKPKEDPKKITRFEDLSEKEKKELRNRWNLMYSRDLLNQIRNGCHYYHVDGSLFFSLDASMMEQYMKLDQLESEFKRLTGELDSVAARMKADCETYTGKARFYSRERLIWAGLPEGHIDTLWGNVASFRWPNYPGLLSDLERYVENAKKSVDDGHRRFDSAVYDAGVVIRLVKPTGVDVSILESLMKTSPNETKNAPMLIREIRTEMNRVQDEADRINASKPGNKAVAVVPTDLRKGSSYLDGEDYEFDKSFFALTDASKPIKLELTHANSGSYSSYAGDLVHIASNSRNKASSWHKKGVIYHEYGHCIDAQRELWKDAKLIEMRKEQIKRLKEKTDKKIFERERDYDKGKWTYKRVNPRSLVAYIDARLIALSEKISDMKESTFTKRGITKADVIEQITSTRDTIKSLVVSYGFGHSTSYFRHERMKETEYLAHAFENAFLGNKVFQKVMPDIYNEMIQYIKALKP